MSRKLEQHWCLCGDGVDPDEEPILVWPAPKHVDGEMFVPVASAMKSPSWFVQVLGGPAAAKSGGAAVLAVAALKDAIRAERQRYSAERSRPKGPAASSKGVHRTRERCHGGGWKGKGACDNGFIAVRVEMGTGDGHIDLRVMNDMRSPLWVEFSDDLFRWARSLKASGDMATLRATVPSARPEGAPRFQPASSSFEWARPDGTIGTLSVSRFDDHGDAVGPQVYATRVASQRSAAWAAYNAELRTGTAPSPATSPASTVPSAPVSAASTPSPASPADIGDIERIDSGPEDETPPKRMRTRWEMDDGL